MFKALVVSANALLHLRSKDPSPVDGIDLVCETPNGGMGGRFELTPQLARDLVNGTYDYVQGVTANSRTAPLATKFGDGEGSVTYTSFHNEPQTTVDMAKMLQEIVLSL